MANVNAISPVSHTLILKRPLTQCLNSMIFKCFRSRDKNILARAYCTYVRPILEYYTPVWNPHSGQLVTKIEGFQSLFNKSHSRIENIAIHMQTSATRTQDPRSSTPHPQLRVYKIAHSFDHCNIPQSSLESNLAYLPLLYI